MATTQIGADNQLEVFHPETDSWVKAIALLQVVGGLQVDLTGPRSLTLENISQELSRQSADGEATAINAGALQALVTELQSSFGTQSATPPSTDTDDATLHARVVLLAQRLSTILTSIAQLQASVVSMEEAIAGQTSASTPKIKNISVSHTAETVFVFPSGTKRFFLRARGGPSDPVGDLVYAWVPGVVAGQSGLGGSDGHAIIPMRSQLAEDNLDFGASIFLYALAAEPIPVVIQYWS